MKWVSCQGINTGWFHLCMVSSAVKFMKLESGMVAAMGRGIKELTFNGYRAPSFSRWKSSMDEWEQWQHDSMNVLNATELRTCQRVRDLEKVPLCKRRAMCSMGMWETPLPRNAVYRLFVLFHLFFIFLCGPSFHSSRTFVALLWTIFKSSTNQM